MSCFWLNKGGSQNFESIAANAFGTALGSSVARQAQGWSSNAGEKMGESIRSLFGATKGLVVNTINHPSSPFRDPVFDHDVFGDSQDTLQDLRNMFAEAEEDRLLTQALNEGSGTMEDLRKMFADRREYLMQRSGVAQKESRPVPLPEVSVSYSYDDSSDANLEIAGAGDFENFFSFNKKMELIGNTADTNIPLFGGEILGDTVAVLSATEKSLQASSKKKIVENLHKVGKGTVHSDKIKLAIDKPNLSADKALNAVEDSLKTKGTKTASIIGETKGTLQSLKFAGNALSATYVFARGAEEYVFSESAGLNSEDIAVNVGTRTIGTVGELAVGHGASHGVGLLTGSISAAASGPLAPFGFVVGYGAGYAVTTITYSFSDLGSDVNNLITEGYRNIYDSFNE